jgi:uncharacterized DUF497 family protein
MAAKKLTKKARLGDIDSVHKYVLQLFMQAREIEFDPEKAIINVRIHKVYFEDAALIFSDPKRIERRDDSEGNTTGEERWQTLGMVKKVLFVVYTERGEKTRIISARTATKAEKRSYYGNDDANRKGWTKAD